VIAAMAVGAPVEGVTGALITIFVVDDAQPLESGTFLIDFASGSVSFPTRPFR
jgi:hypothetical protein